MTHATELRDDVIKKATRALNERLEKEILGAWRAGYDYLHVYTATQPRGGYGHGVDEFSIHWAVIPADLEDPPTWEIGNYRYTESYVLEDIPNHE